MRPFVKSFVDLQISIERHSCQNFRRAKQLNFKINGFKPTPSVHSLQSNLCPSKFYGNNKIFFKGGVCSRRSQPKLLLEKEVGSRDRQAQRVNNHFVKWLREGPTFDSEAGSSSSKVFSVPHACAAWILQKILLQNVPTIF